MYRPSFPPGGQAILMIRPPSMTSNFMLALEFRLLPSLVLSNQRGCMLVNDSGV
jgi:hypothetical protein